MLFESPERTVETLTDLARELTKLSEEFVRWTLKKLSQTPRERKLLGEVTLVRGPAEKLEHQR